MISLKGGWNTQGGALIRNNERANKMPEEIKDVNPVDTSTTEQAVEVVEPATTEEVDQSQEAPSTQEVKPEVEIKPDRPEINYAMEAARKSSEALEIVRQLQQQQQQVQQQPAQPQYSKAQLRAFAETTSDANHKVWALEEIDKLDKVERTSEIRQIFEGQQKKSQEEQQRSQSFQFVVQNFPEIAVRDATGNFAGFNQNSPLYQKINDYMNNPDLARSPQGLIAAAKMAAFDLGVSMNSKLNNKITATTAQLRKEQKRQLISGGGTPAQTESSQSKLAKLAEVYRKTGSREAFKQLAKARGLIPEN
uniref:Uncharacterized protein n=3 Tax=viral metagenome TaxID=1070528 RepID=A0A6H1ZQC6_9ZZZZ